MSVASRLLLVLALALGWVGAVQAATGSVDAPAPGNPVLAELDRGGFLAQYGVANSVGSSDDGTLDGYILTALRGNQHLRSKYAAYRTVFASIEQVQSLPDPKLGYTEYLAPVETRVGPQQRAFSLTQQFPWFGSLSLHGEVNRERAEAARADFHSTALGIVAAVKKAYYDLGYLERALGITEQHIGLLSQWEDVARVRYSTGEGQYTDVIKAQVELGILSNRRAELADQRRPLVAVMNALLNREPLAPVEMAGLGNTKSEALDLDALTTYMRAHHPALISWEHRAEAALDRGRLVKKQGSPSFMLGVNYVQTGDARMDNVNDSGQDAVMASLGVTVPIWRGKYNAASQAAASQYEGAVASRRELSNQLTTNLERAHFQYRDARRKVALYQTALLPKGRQSLGAIRIAYEGGNSSFLDLVDAERLVLEFELSLARAEFDVLIQAAEIEKLVASPLGFFKAKE